MHFQFQIFVICNVKNFLTDFTTFLYLSLFQPTFREILLQNYNLTIPEIMYAGVLYHKKAADGKDILNYKGIQGVCILGTIMVGVC